MRRDAGLSIDVVRLRFEDGTIEQRFREEAFYDARWLRLLLMLCSLVPLSATSSTFVDVLPILFGPMFWELLQSVVPRCPARAIYSQVTLVLCAVPHVAILLSGTRPGEAQPGLCCGAPDGFLQLLLPVFLHSFSATFMSRMGVHGLALCSKLLTAQRRRDDDSHQVVLHVAGCLIGHLIEYTQRLGFQRRQQLIQAAEASRRADSRLNHILKNKSVEACYVIAELEDCMLQIKDGLSNIDQGPPSVSSAPAPPRDQANFEAEVARLRGLLSSMRSIHTETSQWTHRREMFLQLQHGLYQSRMLPTNLEETLQAVMRNDTVEVQLHVPQPPLIELDADMLRLQLEEARSNVLKYRAPGSCLTVHAELQRAQHPRAQHPDAALVGTALDGGEMWELHVTMDNRNREGVPLLSVDQCAAVFREGVKGDYDRGNSLGNGVGLDNVTAAARAVGGRAWLSAYVDLASGHAHTVFHTVLPARVAAGGGPTPHGPKVEEAGLFPLALGQAMPNPVSLSPEMLAVSPSLPHARTKAPWAPVAPSPAKQSDETQFSLPLRRVISRGITLDSDSDTCPSGESNGDTGGDCGCRRELLGESSERRNPLSDDASEVLEDTANVDSAAPDSTSASSARAPQAAAGLPLDGVELQDAMRAACGRPPLCFALDDSPLLQRALLSTFGRLGADPMSRATGTTWAEQEAFVPLVLGHGQHPWGNGGRPSHADIVILDQNLSATDEDRPTGLSRARALALHGFNGMVILHTSYSEQELADADLPPYVDLVLDKVGNPRDLACRIGTAYLERAARLRRDPPPAGTPPVTPHPPLLSEASRPALLPSPQAALGPSTLRLAALGAAFGLAAARVCLAAPHE